MKILNKRNILAGLGLAVLLAAPVAVYAATSGTAANGAAVSPAVSSYYNVNASYAANATPAVDQGNSNQGSGNQGSQGNAPSCCTNGTGCRGAVNNQSSQSGQTGLENQTVNY